MTKTVLVVTSVHWPDDTRIRERLIRALSSDFQVMYAARSPGPTDRSGLTYIELRGGRLRRNLRSIWLGLATQYDVMVIHDPELLPAAVLARLIRRRQVVFDVHEDVPASAYTRAWVPRSLRRVFAMVLAWLLRMVEPILEITLAEPGYRSLFAKDHPCFPNYPDTSGYPEAGNDPSGPAIYLGDVTTERGVDVAVSACASIRVPLVLVGRISLEMESQLRDTTLSDELVIEGLVSNPVAMKRLTQAGVGLSPLRDMPNYRNSQPTKILEYLAVGLPVVASDLPGTRELCEDLEAVFLVEPEDERALAEAISKARSPELSARAKKQAAAIRSRFRWPTEDVLAYYDSLV